MGAIFTAFFFIVVGGAASVGIYFNEHFINEKEKES